jgi:ABC-type branched-subunit amino acid transport system substrate-binding protein
VKIVQKMLSFRLIAFFSSFIFHLFAFIVLHIVVVVEYFYHQTADEYLKEYNRRRGSEYSRFHGYTYDGIWAVALAIQFASQQKDTFLQNFEYRDKNWENVFLWALGNTSFEGVTGPVRFYNNERKASFQLNQFQSGEEVKVGEYSSLQKHLDLTRGEPMKWVMHEISMAENNCN